MGFGGGGGGALPNHQHSLIPLDGGPLDAANVTNASLNQGSVVFSDGVALQELIAPAVPAGEVLSFPALATAPTWQSGPAGSKFELVNSTTLGADANDITTTFPAISQSSISTLRCVATGDFSGTGASLCLQVNSITTSTYEYTQFGTYDGTSLDINTKTGHAFYKLFDGTNAPFYSSFDVSCNTSTDTINIQSLTGESDTSANTGLYTVMGSNSTAAQTTITGIKIYLDDAGKDLLTGSQLSIYKILI